MNNEQNQIDWEDEYLKNVECMSSEITALTLYIRRWRTRALEAETTLAQLTAQMATKPKPNEHPLADMQKKLDMVNSAYDMVKNGYDLEFEARWKLEGEITTVAAERDAAIKELAELKAKDDWREKCKIKERSTGYDIQFREPENNVNLWLDANGKWDSAENVPTSPFPTFDAAEKALAAAPRPEGVE